MSATLWEFNQIPENIYHKINGRKHKTLLPYTEWLQPDVTSWNSLGKTLVLGKIEGGKRKERQRIKWLDGITDSMDMGLGELRELVMDREAWRAAIHGFTKSRTWLSNWTELNSGDENGRT